jgi:hypothetical protein
LVDIKTVASDAEVDVVLTGTQDRAGDRLRVSAQLVAAPDGAVVWVADCAGPTRRFVHPARFRTVSRARSRSVAIPGSTDSATTHGLHACSKMPTLNRARRGRRFCKPTAIGCSGCRVLRELHCRNDTRSEGERPRGLDYSP